MPRLKCWNLTSKFRQNKCIQLSQSEIYLFLVVWGQHQTAVSVKRPRPVRTRTFSDSHDQSHRPFSDRFPLQDTTLQRARSLWSFTWRHSSIRKRNATTTKTTSRDKAIMKPFTSGRTCTRHSSEVQSAPAYRPIIIETPLGTKLTDESRIASTTKRDLH
jgi:hypothetical protein